MGAKRSSLGRGLSSLLHQSSLSGDGEFVDLLSNQNSKQGGQDRLQGTHNAKILTLSIDMIVANVKQPRKNFDDKSLEELSKSIRQHGVLQPIIVRSISREDIDNYESGNVKKGNAYEIIAGERRWRAAKRIGLKEVPVVIRDDLSARDVVLVALVENLHREDLNAMEQAMTLKSIADDFLLTHDDLSKLSGLSRSQVTNLIRFNDLSKVVQALVSDNKLSMGQARPLLTLAHSLQESVATKIIENNWNVRQVEAFVSKLQQQKETPADRAPTSPNIEFFSSDKIATTIKSLSHHLGQSINVKANLKGKGGKIEISFRSKEDFEKLVNRLGQ